LSSCRSSCAIDASEEKLSLLVDVSEEKLELRDMDAVTDVLIEIEACAAPAASASPSTLEARAAALAATVAADGKGGGGIGHSAAGTFDMGAVLGTCGSGAPRYFSSATSPGGRE
jgi:hypothetical protein